MKTKIIFLFSVLSIISYSQPYKEIENIERLNRISKVIETGFFGNQKDWKSEYTLQNGKIINKETFYKEKKRANFEYIYDSNGNFLQMNVTDLNNGVKSVLYDLNYVYNSENLLIEDKFTLYEYYENQKLKSKTHKEYDENLKIAWKYEYEYNDKGLVSKETKTTFIDRQKQIEIESYLYDDYGNVVELNRESNPEMEYPLIVIGARSKYKKENFEYEYQNDIWIKKHLVLERKKYLLSEREIM
ncbi:MAG: hypothetical protein RBR78_02260 [Flavobacteriaceae bacterium]|jgi:hypothetical protein|nr:hypothetical protein [Flavobacteriaceae bacterium]